MDCLGGLGQARCVLIAWQVGVVEGHFATGHHRDINTLILSKPVEDLLEGHGALLQHDLVVVGEAFGKHRNWTAHDRVEFLRLVLDDIIGLAHHDCWQCQINESILELLDLVKALSVLVNLVADNASDHGSGRGDGRNNFAGNHFCLIAVTLSDLVVASAKVRTCGDKVNVEVRVIVLLEICSGQSVSLNALSGNAEVGEQLSNDRLVVISIIGSGLRCRKSSSFAFLGLFWRFNSNSLLHVLSGSHLGGDSFDIITLKRRHA